MPAYEAHLDEIATLLYERHDLSEKAAIRIVMRAQEDGFFSAHDDDPSICTQARAEADATEIHARYNRPPEPASPSSSGPRRDAGGNPGRKRTPPNGGGSTRRKP